MLNRITKAEILAHEWLDLFNTKTNQPRQKKDFMAKFKEIDQGYIRLSPREQEAFTKLINKRVRQILTKHGEPHESVYMRQQDL